MPATVLPEANDGRGAYEVAEQAVRAAAAVITPRVAEMSLPLDQRNVVVSKKGRNNLVTDVDHSSEAAILNILNRAFPHDAILAEESGGRDGTTGYSWHIDPIDGTRNFASGIPHIAVNLALTYNRRILLGMTYDPIRDELFHAIEGGGAFINNQQIRVSETSTLPESMFGMDMGYVDDKAKLLLDMLHGMWPGMQSIRMMGSAALGVAYAAAGRLEIYAHHHVQPWDIAPGLLLVREAGGVVTDLRGNPAVPESGCLVAASPTIHRAFMEATEGTAWRLSQTT